MTTYRSSKSIADKWWLNNQVWATLPSSMRHGWTSTTLSSWLGVSSISWYLSVKVYRNDHTVSSFFLCHQRLSTCCMRIAVLPWGSCDNLWNTETCVSAYSRQNLTSYVEGNTTFYNLNGTIYAAANLTDPVKEYWEYVNWPIADAYPIDLSEYGLIAFVALSYLSPTGVGFSWSRTAWKILVNFAGNWWERWLLFGSCATFASGKESNGQARSVLSKFDKTARWNGHNGLRLMKCIKINLRHSKNASAAHAQVLLDLILMSLSSRIRTHFVSLYPC